MEEQMKSNPQILVVDDEERDLRLVEAMLAPEGYDVVLAHSGQEALDKLSEPTEQRVDLILLNIIMPVLNGFKILQTIRRNFDIPIIVLTARQEVTSIRDALALGADDYVGKPFRTRELLARIEEKLRRTRKTIPSQTS